jgi:ABC-2 type transport system ATP-binding protein
LKWGIRITWQGGIVLDEVIKVEGLSKTYGKQLAVNRLSLSVQRGTVLGLLGANGAGKSTAIDCMLGTKTADHGAVSILGMNPRTDRKRLFEKVGVQFQEGHYQENITVAELCQVTASLYRRPLDFAELLRQFGIEDKELSPVKNLSGGQRQRLFIVLALIPNPEVVFLDELTTGLDAKARRGVWSLLGKWKEKGLSILLTSHFMDEVETLCDQICILNRGETAFCGTVAEAIQASPYDTLEDAYLWFSGEEEQNDESL